MQVLFKGTSQGNAEDEKTDLLDLMMYEPKKNSCYHLIADWRH